ncbi:MAG: hypothetical protein R2734_07710 [Nocardioides sp.]
MRRLHGARRHRQAVRRHACIDGPEIDAHLIDWDKSPPRFAQFRDQERASMARHGFA